MDLSQLGYWFAATCALIGIPFLIRGGPLGPRSGRLLGRLGSWALTQLTPPPQVDERAEYLARMVRAERVRADLDRLRRLLLTDMAMSATRQLGNRLAYDWLQRELDSFRDLRPLPPAYRPVSGWTSSALPVQTANLRSTYQPVRAPEVEILDIGWKR